MPMFKKEKKVVELILQHVEKTADCVHETTKTLQAYVTGQATDNWADDHKIYTLESEADKLLREIRELLYSGAYLPLIRGDMYRLMSTVDRVSNRAEACFDFFRNQKPEIPDEFRGSFDKSLQLTTECFSAFYKAMQAFFNTKDSLDKVREHSRSVGELESKIDEVEREATSRIFDSAFELSHKIHLSHALRRVAAISDSIENSADELELISLKSII